MPPSTSLDDLRRRIDQMDDRLHDLLMERAAVVGEIARAKEGNAVPALRPGREAQILRRLVARHAGPFPRPLVVRIWRELLSGTIALQTNFVVAVLAPDHGLGYWDLARDHYGSHTPMMAYGSHGEVVRAVSEGRASVGVLPMPEDGERDPWWPLLVGPGAGSLKVIARLPFAGRGNARAAGGDALAISRGEPEPSGIDRSLVIIEASAEMSRARLIAALTAAGLVPTLFTLTEPAAGIAVNLVEVDDVRSSADPRLRAALGPLGDKVLRVSLLGTYARPLTAAELAGETAETRA